MPVSEELEDMRARQYMLEFQRGSIAAKEKLYNAYYECTRGRVAKALYAFHVCGSLDCRVVADDIVQELWTYMYSGATLREENIAPSRRSAFLELLCDERLGIKRETRHIAIVHWDELRELVAKDANLFRRFLMDINHAFLTEVFTAPCFMDFVRKTANITQPKSKIEKCQDYAPKKCQEVLDFEEFADTEQAKERLNRLIFEALFLHYGFGYIKSLLHWSRIYDCIVRNWLTMRALYATKEWLRQNKHSLQESEYSPDIEETKQYVHWDEPDPLVEWSREERNQRILDEIIVGLPEAHQAILSSIAAGDGMPDITRDQRISGERASYHRRGAIKKIIAELAKREELICITIGETPPEGWELVDIRANRRNAPMRWYRPNRDGGAKL